MESISFCIVVVVFVASTGDSSAAIFQTLSVSNVNEWGDWGDDQYCGEGTYAFGYNLKIERRQGNGDDTALNGIKLLCQSPYVYTSRHGEATSSVGPWGSWVGEALCDARGGLPHFLTSFRFQNEGKQWRGDDTSANFLKFKCRDLDGFQPSYEMTGPGYGLWGGYGSWSSECQAGTAICGIKTKVEKPQGGGDDTALNDVLFYCCR